MNNRLAKMLLALVLTFSLVVSQSTVFAFNTGQPASNRDNQSDLPAALRSLLRQVDEDYSDDAEIKIIVQINDVTMQSVYDLSVPNIADVRTADGLAEQIAYAKLSQGFLRNALDALALNYEVTETYDTVLNGLAIKTSFGSAKLIAQLPEISLLEVNRVLPAPKVADATNYRALKSSFSNGMVHAEEAWSSAYSGKGQLVAIIDSGADPAHDVFSDLLDGAKYANQASVQSLIDNPDYNLSKGKWFSKKIPFGYNYASRNTNIKEDREVSHGMHVAGIVAANGGERKGVAPDAQLAIMRVFGGMFGGTTPEIYNKAIDDAVKLGADSINMSLGATGTTDGRVEETTVAALKRAQQAGIVVAIAAGNDGFMGFGALKGPDAKNPNYGLINSPAVIDTSMCVASVDNENIRERAILVVGAEQNKKILYAPSANYDDDEEISSMLKSENGFVDVGYGYEENYVGKNLVGKFALIKRGEDPAKNEDFFFSDKVQIAQQNGAIAAIVYNNIALEPIFAMSMKDEQLNIPSFFISREDGEYLLANSALKIKFLDGLQIVKNTLTPYGLSNFSSWGVTEEGNFKPDISAPGGKIYSSINNNKYQVMSGTSMATPHVAGGIALVMERVEKDFPAISGVAKHALVKNLLMSTAVPHRFKLDEERYGSPRGQGAGLMTLDRAVKSNVVAIGTNGISSINLGNLSGNSITVEGKLKNYGSSDKAFDYYGVMTSDTVEAGLVTLQPQLLSITSGAAISAPMNTSGPAIVVNGGSEQDFRVEFELTDDQLNDLQSNMPNGFFLEGYVLFKGREGATDISIPFVGFKGVTINGEVQTWANLPVIERPIYDYSDDYQPMYYRFSNLIDTPFTFIGSYVLDTVKVLGEMIDSTYENPNFDADKIAFSPNGDAMADTAHFVGTFLRNYRDFEINVYHAADTTKKMPVFTVDKDEDFGMRNFYSPNPFMQDGNMVSTKNHWGWDGKSAGGEVADDGRYVLEVGVRPDMAAGKMQTMDFPLILDTVFPVIKKSSYDRANGIFKLEQVIENGSGVRERVIVADPGDENSTVFECDAAGTFTGLDSIDPDTAVLRLSDYAYNTIEIPLSKAERDGTQHMLKVVPQVNLGTVVPNDKFSYRVVDAAGNEVEDIYNLAVGEYTIEITYVDDKYELIASEGSVAGDNSKIRFSVKSTDEDLIQVVVKFRYKDLSLCSIKVINDSNAKMKLFAVDTKDGSVGQGKDYQLMPYFGGSGFYEAWVPPSTYKLVVTDLDTDDYTADVKDINNDPLEVIVVAPNDAIGSAHFGTTVEIKEKSYKINKPLIVKLARNGYQGAVDVDLIARDFFKTRASATIAAGQNQVEIAAPFKLTYDVYGKCGEGYGIKSQEINYSYTGETYRTVTLTLQAGATSDAIPIDKTLLEAFMNRAKNSDPKAYEDDSWNAVEIAYYNARKVYEDATATQQQIDEVTKQLKTALENLVERVDGASKAELKKKIEEATEIYSNLDDSYTERSKEFLMISIESAKMSYNSDEPEFQNPKHIAAMIDLLDRAIKNLTKKDGKPDKSELKLKLEQLDEIRAHREDYDLGGEDIDAAYAYAKDFYDDPDATKEDVNRAVDLIKETLSFIKSKVSKADLVAEIAAAEALDLLDYELYKRDEFKQALRAAKEVNQDNLATKDAIDMAIQNLRAAKDQLVLFGEPIEPDQPELRTVDAYVLKADKSGLSMADQTLDQHAVTLISKVDGTHELRVKFNEMTMQGNTAGVSKLYVKVGDQYVAATAAEQGVFTMPLAADMVRAATDINDTELMIKFEMYPIVPGHSAAVPAVLLLDWNGDFDSSQFTPDDGSNDNSGDNGGDNSGGNTGDNSGDNTGDNTGDGSETPTIPDMSTARTVKAYILKTDMKDLSMANSSLDQNQVSLVKKDDATYTMLIKFNPMTIGEVTGGVTEFYVRVADQFIKATAVGDGRFIVDIPATMVKAETEQTDQFIAAKFAMEPVVPGHEDAVKAFLLLDWNGDYQPGGSDQEPGDGDKEPGDDDQSNGDGDQNVGDEDQSGDNDQSGDDNQESDDADDDSSDKKSSGKGIVISASQLNANGQTTAPPADDQTKVDAEQSVVGTADNHLTYNGQPLVDTEANAWYAGAVKYALEKKLMVGVGKRSFKPNEATTRAMMVQILHRLSGDDNMVKSTNYSDVPAGKWFTQAVNWATNKNIVAGIGGGKFAPNQKLTREQLVMMLYRYARLMQYDTLFTKNLSAFKDANSVAPYAENAMKWAVSKGLVNGKGGQMLAPKAGATRAEMASILQRFIEKIVK